MSRRPEPGQIALVLAQILGGVALAFAAVAVGLAVVR